MSPRQNNAQDDDILPEYDFRGGVRGKYFEAYQQGTNMVLLDPDIAAVFHSSASVNEALRLLVNIADTKATRSTSTSSKRQRRPNKPLQPTSRVKRPRRKRA